MRVSQKSAKHARGDVRFFPVLCDFAWARAPRRDTFRAQLRRCAFITRVISRIRTARGGILFYARIIAELKTIGVSVRREFAVGRWDLRIGQPKLRRLRMTSRKLYRVARREIVSSSILKSYSKEVRREEINIIRTIVCLLLSRCHRE